MKCHLGIKVPREKHRLNVFANRMLKEYLDLGGSGRRLEKTAL
jgi:hypothetical protein